MTWKERSDYNADIVSGVEMIKILMCGNHPSNKGGMTSVISQILSFDWENMDIKMKFIPTFYPGNNVKKLLFFWVSYVRILIALFFYRPQIIHMHMSYKGSFYRKFLIHKLCRRFGVKDIIHLHGSEFEKWYAEASQNLQNKIKELLRECDMVFVLGEKWKNVVEKIEPEANVTVINNAVRIPQETVRWNEDVCQLLYMGVLIPRKGLDILLDSLSMLKDSGRIAKIHLAIVGTGPEENRLKASCREKELGDAVSFYGWKTGDEKAEIIKKSQVAVMPSYNEGLPIAVLEALSYGMPVIATGVGDMEAAVKDGVNGYIIKPGDAKTLADKIELISREDTFNEMSMRSRQLAENIFSEEIYVQKLVKYYSELY